MSIEKAEKLNLDSYYSNQFSRLLADIDAESLVRMKLTCGDGYTQWINITPSQAGQIQTMLISGRGEPAPELDPVHEACHNIRFIAVENHGHLYTSDELIALFEDWADSDTEDYIIAEVKRRLLANI
jgi:hypothetical protein